MIMVLLDGGLRLMKYRSVRLIMIKRFFNIVEPTTTRWLCKIIK